MTKLSIHSIGSDHAVGDPGVQHLLAACPLAGSVAADSPEEPPNRNALALSTGRKAAAEPGTEAVVRSCKFSLNFVFCYYFRQTTGRGSVEEQRGEDGSCSTA